MTADISLEDEDDPLESIDEDWGAPAVSEPPVVSAPAASTRGRRRTTRYRKKRR